MSILELKGIHKSFGAVKALRGVDLSVEKAEIHALIGENGAGKSTLMKVLSGALRPESGSMELDGGIYAPNSPLEGRSSGIGMIYQELNLAPHLNVEENVTLGLERTKAGRLVSDTKRVREILDELGQSDIETSGQVNRLSIGKQQLVEVARALYSNAKIVVMDEPTSSLSAEDTVALFQAITRMKEKGITVIYISHFLEEIKQICDRYTVLRDGESVAIGEVGSTPISKLVEDMIGRSVDELYPEMDSTPGSQVLKLETLVGEDQLPSDASFSLRKGEIFGIAGLVGAGRSETIRSIFGLRKSKSGQLEIDGHPKIKLEYMSPRKALDAGVDLLSENRKEEGLATELSILTNTTLSSLSKYKSGLFLKLKKERKGATSWLEKLGVKLDQMDDPVSSLSGGNQQKVCLARMLHNDSEILFLDEPTRGIDIGSKAEIYLLMRELAATGKSIVMISSYLPELMGMCDSLAVMHRGHLSKKRKIGNWTEKEIMSLATSGNKEKEAA